MLCDYMPTARQKKQKIRKGADKYLLSIDRKYDMVLKQIIDLGYEDLVVPYQKGWKRSFVLHDNVRENKQAAFFEGILEKINTVQYSMRKDFKMKRRGRGRWGYIDQPQELETLYSYDFKQMKFTEEEIPWFHPEEYWYNRLWYTRYVFSEPWRFVLKTEPNMITKRKRLNEELERQLHELSTIVDFYPARARLCKIQGYSYRGWGLDYQDDNNPFKNRQKQLVVQELFDMEYIPAL